MTDRATTTTTDDTQESATMTVDDALTELAALAYEDDGRCARLCDGCFRSCPNAAVPVTL